MSENVDIEIKQENKQQAEGVNMSVENKHSSENGCSQLHLLVGDGTPPWLCDILNTIDDPTTMSADAFISTIYVLIYECGFTINGGPINPDVTYNIKVMREINDYSFLQRVDSSYKLCFKLNSFPNNCILVAIPIDNIMIVNFYMTNCKTLSLSFNMNDFIDIKYDFPKLKNGKELSYRLNTSLCEIRVRLLQDSDIADPKHILSLPTEILLDICNYLTPTSYFYFSLTCKRIYYTVFNDESVWSKIGRLYLPCRRRANETWRDFVYYQFRKQREQTIRPHVYAGLLDWPFPFIIRSD